MKFRTWSKFTWIVMLTITSSLGVVGCGAGDSFRPASYPQTFSEPPPSKKEIPDYTAEQLKNGLTGAAQVLVNRIPTVEELQQIDLSGLEGYKSVIREYMNSTRFRDAMRTYHIDYFATYRPSGDEGDPSINYNEPANLLTHLITTDGDYREAVLADYCVTDALAVVPCSSFNNSPDRAATHAAGVLTTRAFLDKWKSAYNFKRVKKAFEAFACSEYPDPTDPGMTSAEVSSTANGSTNDFNATTGSNACLQCHRSLNARAVPYLNFSRNGFYFEFQANGEYPNSVPVEQRSVTDLADVVAYPYMLLNTGSTAQPVIPVPRYKGQSISTIREYAEIFSETPEFKHCLVRRFSNFMMGRPNFDTMLSGFEPVLNNPNVFNVKEILLDIAIRPDFVIR